MLPPTLGPDGGALHQIDALTAELRSVYLDAFAPAYDEALAVGSRFEPADGTGRLDPDYVADIAGCRAVTAALAATVSRHLPGARLLGRADESPTVIDSTWLHRDRLVAIEWDYSFDFGDPDGLTVREITR